MTTRPKCKRPRCPNLAYTARNAQGYCVKHARAAGLQLPKVPAEPVAQHVRRLLDRGWTRSQLAKAAGVGVETICSVRDLRYPRIYGETAAKLLACDGAPEDPALQPKWRATRRLQALRAAGWTVREIAEGTQLTTTEISKLCNHPEGSIYRDTWHKISDFYDEHAGPTIRPCTPNIRAKRWLTPLMWDDIDDPDEQPYRPTRALNSPRREVTQDDRAAVAKLYAHYGNWHQIYKATGIIQPSTEGILTAKRGATQTKHILDRVHAAAKAIPTPVNWADYLPARGRPLKRPPTPVDLDNIEKARQVCGTYAEVDARVGLPEAYCSAAVRGQRTFILDAWARRLADLAAQAVGEEAA